MDDEPVTYPQGVAISLREDIIPASRPTPSRKLSRRRTLSTWAWTAAAILGFTVGGWNLWHAATAHATTAVKSTPLPRELITKPIEELQVGEWVLAGNPLDEPDLAFGEEVDPETWRRIELRAPKPDGSHADVVLLRPLFWLEDEDVVLGRTVEISVPECGIDGEAEVLAIGPCPAISPQPHHEARILTGTFRHHHARVFDVQIGTESKPLGTTGNHPFWSEDRQDFVRADELRVGERLKNADDTFTTVAWINERPGRHTVYNLEVQVDHTYHVGQNGVLVHNALPCDMHHGTPRQIIKWASAKYSIPRAAIQGTSARPNRVAVPRAIHQAGHNGGANGGQPRYNPEFRKRIELLEKIKGGSITAEDIWDIRSRMLWEYFGVE